MKVIDFIKKTEMVDADVASHISVKQYIPSVDKMDIAQKVIDFSVEYDRGFVKFDSYKKMLAFTFAVIEAHTDINFSGDWNGKISEYDALCEHDLLERIIDTFRKDYESSLVVLDMLCSDLLTDNSVEASIAKIATSISENLDILTGSLSDKIDGFDIKKIIPSDLDFNKLIKLLNKVK